TDARDLAGAGIVVVRGNCDGDDARAQQPDRMPRGAGDRGGGRNSGGGQGHRNAGEAGRACGGACDGSGGGKFGVDDRAAVGGMDWIPMGRVRMAFIVTGSLGLLWIPLWRAVSGPGAPVATQEGRVTPFRDRRLWAVCGANALHAI